MDREIKTASMAIHPPMSAFTVAAFCKAHRISRAELLFRFLKYSTFSSGPKGVPTQPL
jgi:hypothetical protein